MGNETEIRKGAPSHATNPEGLTSVEADGIYPELRRFSADFAADHDLPLLAEDESAAEMRSQIVEQDRENQDVLDAVKAYADYLQNHFAQVEELAPPLSMAISQVVHNLLMTALKCGRGMYVEAYVDLYGDTDNSVYTQVLNMQTLYPATDFAGALGRIQELSEQIQQASQKVG